MDASLEAQVRSDLAKAGLAATDTEIAKLVADRPELRRRLDALADLVADDAAPAEVFRPEDAFRDVMSW